MVLTVLWLCALCGALWLYLRRHYGYFSRHGVTTPPYLPLVGHMGKITLKQEHFTDQIERFYTSYPGERFIGRFEFFRPALMIRDIELVKKMAVKDFDHFIDHRAIIDETTDPLFGRNLFSMKGKFIGRFEYIRPSLMIRDIELIKKIAVKDFDYFIDHRNFVDETSDPLFGRNLISMKGQEWRDMRSTLSPAFTSSKMRHMVPFMVEVGDQMIKVLKQKIQDSKTGYIDIDVKDLTTRYANDVIASCAFGLKVDSHADVDNQFYAMGKISSTFNFEQLLKFFAFSNFPKIMRALNVTLFSKDTQDFFRDLVMSTMRNREEKHIIRPDMIHLLMEAKKGRLNYDEKSKDSDAGFATVEESQVGKKTIDRIWSDTDLVAQAVLFFIAGFETVSSGMSFLLYELAVNPDVQERLAQEIKDHDTQHGGKFDYNSVQNMVYMDMVVSEVLRMWPPGVALDRECVKDYNCGKPNSKAKEDFILRKGIGVSIPVWSFHHDPQYFPDPYKFDPERFSEQNKHTINPFAYMPFGVGPRNCIGSRFALCEMKVMVYQLLQHMEISPGEKTTIPAVLDPDTFNIRIKGGHWLRFRARN